MNPRIEEYNYYHDPRVQAGMFHSCWRIVRQDGKSAVIEFDEGWIVECLYIEEIDKIIDGWIAERLDFTIHCSELGKASKEKHDNYIAFSHETNKAYYNAWENWKIPEEEKAKLEILRLEKVKAADDYNEEFNKILELAKLQNPIEDVTKRLGFESVTNYDRDEIREYCMRVTIEFEVCGLCEGSGSVVNPNIDCCGLTYDDFYDDPDFEDDYFSGRYNETCPTCKGLRVVAQPVFPEWLSVTIRDYENSQWEDIEARCSEMAMGA